MAMTVGDLVQFGRAAVALVLLAGCANFQPGELKPTDKTAVVRAGQWGKVYRGGYVEIASVNGVEPSWRLRSEMELDAGAQTALFYVYLCKESFSHCDSIAEARVEFRAQAGHTYQVRAREQVNGSNRFWVWIEDQATGKAVGGTPPGVPP
jgi:hypothetical protein